MTDRPDRAARYGIFLIPDPQTSAAVTTITTQLRAQYGLVSAGAFPPHVTLAGSLLLAGNPDQARSNLMGALDEVLADRRSFAMTNAGLARLSNSVVYDVHGRDGAPNTELLALTAVIRSAVTSRLAPTAPGTLAADVRGPNQWHGHLSLASHEMDERPNLHDEVFAYVQGLDVHPPPSFHADLVALYEFDHPDWAGRWWTEMSWAYVRSWRLQHGSGTVTADA